MSRTAKNALFWFVVVAVGAAAIALLVTAATGQEGGGDEPTLTADETDVLAKTVGAGQIETDRANAKLYVEQQTSVADLPRGRTLATRLDLPLEFDSAVQEATQLVVGEVGDQYLQYGTEPLTGYEVTVLASVLTIGDEVLVVTQPAGLTLVNGEPSLTYGSAGELLESGKTYALLVKRDDLETQLIRGHAYEVIQGDTLVRLSAFPGNELLDGQPLDSIVDAVPAEKRIVE